MSWVITTPTGEVESDSFVLDDLEYCEKAADTPWSILNPYKDAKVARAFYRTALVRQGRSPKEADAEVGSVTLKRLKTAFEFRPDEPIEGDGGDADPLEGSSSPSSSTGAPSATTGRRQRVAASA